MANLQELLKAKSETILEHWFDLIIATYPAESVQYFKRTKDAFQNPVGHTIHREMKAVFDELLTGLDRERVSPFVDRIVRIRAVQDYAPSQAVGFVLGLKQVVRKALAKELEAAAGARGLLDQLTDFESRVDELALIAFDIYMACRQKIYEIQAQEVKSMYYNVLRRADILCPIPEQEEPDMPPEK